MQIQLRLGEHLADFGEMNEVTAAVHVHCLQLALAAEDQFDKIMDYLAVAEASGVHERALTVGNCVLGNDAGKHCLHVAIGC